MSCVCAGRVVLCGRTANTLRNDEKRERGLFVCLPGCVSACVRAGWCGGVLRLWRRAPQRPLAVEEGAGEALMVFRKDFLKCEQMLDAARRTAHFPELRAESHYIYGESLMISTVSR